MAWSGRRRRTSLAVAGAALVTVGGIILTLAVTAQQPSPPAAPAVTAARIATPAPVATPTPSATPTPGDRRTPARETATAALELPRSEPVAISVPRLKVRSDLEQLELDEQGAMQVPRDPDKAGWFSPSPPPGAIGRSVIAGHVTWNHRPAAFFRLAELRAGDRIDVRRQDGRTAVFTVESVGRFPKDKFPTGQVYGASDHAALRLITCGGAYDESAHRYLDNVVVSARLTQVGSR